MEIEYKSKKLEKICTVASAAEKAYGSDMAEKIHLRIKQIKASDTIEELIQYSVGRCHPLHQNREGQYAMDLVHPQRLIFEKKGDTVQIANILEIADYH